jgi:branched-chain amino acid transport system substrate-binding protein
MLACLAVLAVIALVLTGCGSGDDGAATGEDTGTSEPIVVGAAQGFTGFMVTWDVPVYNAALLAIEDINADGGVLGRQVKMIDADTKSDVSLGPTAASQVLDEGAVMLLVSTDFDMGSPSALVAQNAGVPSFSGAVSPMFGAQGVGDLAFSSSDSATEEAAAGAQFAYNKGWRNVYILVDETVAAERDYGKYFEEAFTHLGGTVAGRDVFKNDDQSIAAQITHFKSLSPAPDVMVLASYAPGGPAALRQIRAAGIDIPVIGADDWDGVFWLEAVPGVKDVYGCVPRSMFGDDPDPAVNEFFKRLEKKVGKPIDSSLAIAGYTAIQLWANAVEEAGTTEGKAVGKALEQTTNFPTITGEVSYTATDHIIYGRDMTIIGFWDGTGHFVERVTPEFTPEYTFGTN